jgi:hypothetical protein
MDNYLLTTGTDYEGESPRGLYSTRQKAIEEANKLKPEDFSEDTVNIYVIEVDYDYDYDPPCIWSKRLNSGKMVIGTKDGE